MTSTDVNSGCLALRELFKEFMAFLAGCWMSLFCKEKCCNYAYLGLWLSQSQAKYENVKEQHKTRLCLTLRESSG